MSDFTTFWSLRVKPGEKVKYKVPDSQNLYITNACIVESPEGSMSLPNRLYINHLNDKNETTTDTFLCVLVPDKKPHYSFNYRTIQNDVFELGVNGDSVIDVAGYMDYDDQ